MSASHYLLTSNIDDGGVLWEKPLLFVTHQAGHMPEPGAGKLAELKSFSSPIVYVLWYSFKYLHGNRIQYILFSLTYLESTDHYKVLCYTDTVYESFILWPILFLVYVINSLLFIFALISYLLLF